MRCRPGACAADGAPGPTRIHARALRPGRVQLVDGKWRRLFACRRRSQRRRHFEGRMGWPKIPARSLAACVGRRRSCGHWASRLRSVAKAEPEIGSSGCVLLPKIPSAPSATSVSMSLGQDGLNLPVTSATTTLARFDRSAHGRAGPPARPTMLTVLTQTPPFRAQTPSRPGRNLTAPTSERLRRLSGCQRWHGGSRGPAP
jgi:hypothetical protein